jgi:hypothetical protein
MLLNQFQVVVAFYAHCSLIRRLPSAQPVPSIRLILRRTKLSSPQTSHSSAFCSPCFTDDSLNVDTAHRLTRARIGLNVRLGGSYDAGLRPPSPDVHTRMQVIFARTLSDSRMLITLLLRAC